MISFDASTSTMRANIFNEQNKEIATCDFVFACSDKKEKKISQWPQELITMLYEK